ncbi:hypothetical protein K1T71_002414 [Dendrolimus kikuchii]|uniref:Uncharacterized protein n=1 Tax=Dendrolimus kikuchii TaxID=765133 RepID=A0ACC1DDM4_9NEOP|nr:hypothetical protein K1T71_002414 [Dendrolimus kikuchii]
MVLGELTYCSKYFSKLIGFKNLISAVWFSARRRYTCCVEPGPLRQAMLRWARRRQLHCSWRLLLLVLQNRHTESRPSFLHEFVF